jgi:hypothetical protein
MKPPTTFVYSILSVLVASTAFCASTITYEQLLQNSENFAKYLTYTNGKFPVTNNLISTLAKDEAKYPKDSFVRKAEGVRILIHPRISKMMEAFLQEKLKHGSSKEKALYHGMTVNQFIDRLLQKRPLMFMSRNDQTRLPGHVQPSDTQFNPVQEQWFRVGTDNEQGPLVLADYLSYDEMELSAFVNVATPTYFINDGNRNNGGKPGAPESFQPEGIYIAAVGARFEVPGRMEYKYLDVNRTRNVHDPMYPLFQQWESLYEVNASQDVIYGGYDDRAGVQLPNINRHGYAVRIQLTLEPIILYANQVAGEQGRKARLRLVGLGIGVWAVNQLEQGKVIVEVVKNIIRSNDLPHITMIEFPWFPNDALLSGQTLDQITYTNLPANAYGQVDVVISGKLFDRRGHQITFEQNKANPAAPINQGELLVAVYAWDSNSFPGNEFWENMLDASGDPAAACCSNIQELQNPYINTSLRADKKLVKLGSEQVLSAAGPHHPHSQASQASPPPNQSGPSGGPLVPAASQNAPRKQPSPQQQPFGGPNQAGPPFPPFGGLSQAGHAGHAGPPFPPFGGSIQAGQAGHAGPPFPPFGGSSHAGPPFPPFGGSVVNINPQQGPPFGGSPPLGRSNPQQSPPFGGSSQASPNVNAPPNPHAKVPSQVAPPHPNPSPPNANATPNPSTQNPSQMAVRPATPGSQPAPFHAPARGQGKYVASIRSCNGFVLPGAYSAVRYESAPSYGWVIDPVEGTICENNEKRCLNYVPEENRGFRSLSLVKVGSSIGDTMRFNVFQVGTDANGEKLVRIHSRFYPNIYLDADEYLNGSMMMWPRNERAQQIFTLSDLAQGTPKPASNPIPKVTVSPHPYVGGSSQADQRAVLGPHPAPPHTRAYAPGKFTANIKIFVGFAIPGEETAVYSPQVQGYVWAINTVVDTICDARNEKRCLNVTNLASGSLSMTTLGNGDIPVTMKFYLRKIGDLQYDDKMVQICSYAEPGLCMNASDIQNGSIRMSRSVGPETFVTISRVHPQPDPQPWPSMYNWTRIPPQPNSHLPNVNESERPSAQAKQSARTPSNAAPSHSPSVTTGAPAKYAAQPTEAPAKPAAQPAEAPTKPAAQTAGAPTKAPSPPAGGQVKPGSSPLSVPPNVNAPPSATAQDRSNVRRSSSSASSLSPRESSSSTSPSSTRDSSYSSSSSEGSSRSTPSSTRGSSYSSSSSSGGSSSGGSSKSSSSSSGGSSKSTSGGPAKSTSPSSPGSSASSKPTSSGNNTGTSNSLLAICVLIPLILDLIPSSSFIAILIGLAR